MLDGPQRPFNYSQLALTTQSDLRKNAQELAQLTKDTAVGLWEMGRILANAQDKLAEHKTGTFQQWVEAETGLSSRTAYRLINVFRVFNRAKLAQIDFGPSALYLLSEPSTPEPARTEALQRAEQGERITHARAQEIVATYLPPPDLDDDELEDAPAQEAPYQLPPEFREFEREELLPRLHDAAAADAPQLLSGITEPEPPAQEQKDEGAEENVRDSIIEILRNTDISDEADIERAAEELMEVLGQNSGSIAVAARFGIELARGPKTLRDLTCYAIWTSGKSMDNMDRNEYLRWRKRALRLLDALSYAGGVGVYQHKLENGQTCFGLIPPDEGAC